MDSIGESDTLPKVALDRNTELNDMRKTVPLGLHEDEIAKLMKWNRDSPPYLQSCVHDLIYERSLKQPDARAVCAWDGDFTYKELNDFSTALAKRLVLCKIGPEVFVPLYFKKCRWTPVAMLGVIKAGAAFVLLDPTYPLKRLQSICQQVGADVVLSSEDLSTIAADSLTAKVMAIGEGSIVSWCDTTDWKEPEVKPHNALYAVFTSGSTGQPKGTIIEHGSYCTGAFEVSRTCYIDHKSRVLQNASYAFDVSILEHLTTLLMGGCICIPSMEDQRSNTARAASSLNVTWAFFTPTVARILDPKAMPTLQTVVLGGEALNDSDVSRWQQHVELINAYGPAECTGLPVTQSSAILGDSRNIGHPNAARCWIIDIDDHHTLLPIGVVGELLIEGPTVARSYMNDVGKAGASFITAPDWLRKFRSMNGEKELENTNSRLYKTGDLVQYTDNGSLRYIGRKDTQVKVHGQRIELAEVEHHVRERLPEAADVVAEVVSSAEGIILPMLVAFIFLGQENGSEVRYDHAGSPLAAPSQNFSSIALQIESHMYESVPNSMVPAVYIPLSFVPLAKSGKLNRQRLRKCAAALSQLEIQTYRGAGKKKWTPVTEAEIRLQEIVARVLSVPVDTIEDDSFLRIGGDSLKAMHIAAQCHTLGINITVADIFSFKTISQIVRTDGVEGGKSTALEQPQPIIQTENNVTTENMAIKAMAEIHVPNAEIEDIYPCSSIQRGMLLSQIRDPDFYYVRQRWAVTSESGLPDIERLKYAWQSLVDNHPLLRTVIVGSMGNQNDFYQVVLKTAFAEITVLHVDSGNILTTFMDSLRPLDIWHKPSHRLTILVNSDGQVLCELGINHVLIDNDSLGLLSRDLVLAYDGTYPDANRALFKNYISRLKKLTVVATPEYWKHYLDGIEPCLFPTTATTSPNNKDPKVLQEVSTTLCSPQEIFQFCERKGITVPNLIHVVWALILRSYVGSESVSFLYMASARDLLLSGRNCTIGPMLTGLVCRVDLPSNASLISVIRNTHRDAINNLNHKDFPFDQSIHEMANLRINTAVTIVASDSSFTPQGSSIKMIDVGYDDPSECDLLLQVFIGRTAIKVTVVYWSPNVLEETAASVARLFQDLIPQVMNKPDASLGDVTFISSFDKQLLGKWSGDSIDEAASCIHEEIIHHCSAKPSRPAICSWEGEITYGELDDLSSKLAAHLINAGVVPELIVPLYFEKSYWTTVAILGVMKAGAAFLLLDPSHPFERLQLICQEVDANLVVSSSSNVETAKGLAKQVIEIGYKDSTWRQDGNVWEPSSAGPYNAAYAIFTSGSTGQPKGIITEHAAYCSGAKYHTSELNINENSRVLQFSSYAFDASIIETLTTLMAGGCVCVPSDAERMSDLSGAATRLRANIVCVTPSLARQYSPMDLPSIETLALAGEAVSAIDLSIWAPCVKLVIAYGPSECAVMASSRSDIKQDDDPSNLGYAVGCRHWVVDQNNYNSLLPIGTVGELVIEGPIVSRGYINQPEKTAAVFIPSPIWLSNFRPSSQKTKCYLTGDLVQYLSDGSLRYVGRKDTQVKLRGQRVELGEIEQHIRQAFIGLKDVVVDVVIPSEEGGAPVLTAFLWTGHNEVEARAHPLLFAAPSQQFRTESTRVVCLLATTIPTYMVPDAFVPLTHVPRNNAGKIDRKRLRQTSSQLSRDDLAEYLAVGTVYRPPKTNSEASLQRFVAETIKRPLQSIGLDQSFFRLGGDSISAMKLVAVARSQGFDMGVVDVFKNPQLSNLASVMRAKANVSVGAVELFSLLPGGEQAEKLIVTAMAQCNVGKDHIEDMYPCTPLQEGMMALTIKRKGSYFSDFFYKITPGTDLPRLSQAWDRVAQRNAILRTRVIESESSGLMQVVLKESISRGSESSVEAYCRRDYGLSMGLGSPLMYLAFAPQEVGSSEFILVVTMHHCLYDGWSIPLLLEEVENAYHSTALETKPIVEYSSFVQYVLSVNNSDAPQFWRSQFSDLTAMRFPKPKTAIYSPTRIQSVKQVISMPSLQGAENITDSTIVKLGWAILMAKYTNLDDVVFGVTVTGRGAPIPGIDQITGPTIGTVPFRCRLQAEENIMESLTNVQDHTLAILPYEHFGLQNIKNLNAEADSACDFQSLLVIQSPGSLNSSLLQSSNQEDEDWLKFASTALTIQCELSHHRDTIKMSVYYDAGLLQHDQVQRIVQQFEHIVLQLVTLPDVLVKDVTVCSKKDLEQLRIWNADIPIDVHIPLHHLIQKNVHSRPNFKAIAAWDGDMSYMELDLLSDKLACHLVDLGVRSESPVPVMFSKSLWVVVATLAVLKAGGTFVPLDPSTPTERIREIIRQSQATLALASPTDAEALFNLIDNVFIVSTLNVKNLKGRVSDVSLPAIDPAQAAVVLFTSGSTGKPKGIILEHANLSTTITDHGQRLNFNARSRVLQFASYSFDISVYEIFTTLAHGGCVCVPSQSQRMNSLAQFVQEKGVNLAFLTPSVAKIYSPEDFESLETVVLTGEPVNEDNVNVWAPKTKLFNAYGPAECTICAVCPLIENGWEVGTVGSTVGSVGWITNPSNPNSLAAIGAVGELVLEGPVVARGYLRNPDNTQMAFMEPPAWIKQFRKRPGRFYQTGDLVQYNPDGTLRYLGRKDTQVKLNGQRIELSEIEYHIRHASQNIENVLVEIIRFDKKRAPVLVAFLQCDKTQKWSSSDTKPGIITSASAGFNTIVRQIQSKLPELVPRFMVPSLFVPISHVPLTNNGKVHRHQIQTRALALTEEEIQTYMNASTYQPPPSTADEKLLAVLWETTLDLAESQINRNANFFHVGGDSIAAMKLVAAARKKGYELTVAQIFSSPILESMALIFSKGSTQQSCVPEPFSLISDEQLLQSLWEAVEQQCGLTNTEIDDIYPCTALQAGMIALTIKRPSAYVSIGAYELLPDVDLHNFCQAVEMVVDANPILRTRVIQCEHGLFQVVTRSMEIWEQVDKDSISMLPGSQLCRLSITKAHNESACNIFAVNIHHALYDGWSFALIIDQIQAAYQGNQLMPQPFSPFMKYLSTIDEHSTEEYWRTQFSGITAAEYPPLPYQGYAPTANMFLKNSIHFSEISRSQFTLSTMIRLAWALLLSHRTDSSDVSFGSIVSGRSANVAGAEQLTGPLIATVPLRTQINWNDTVAEALDREQHRTTQMIPFEQYGLQNIRRVSSDAAVACGFQSQVIVQPELPDGGDSVFKSNGLMSDDRVEFGSYPLGLECVLKNDKSSANVVLHFDTNVLRLEQAESMMDQFERILQQVHNDQSQPLNELNLLSSQDLQTILKWNEVMPRDRATCLHDLVHQSALADPHSPAISSWDGDLSYAELDKASTRLAIYLREVGVGPDTVVCLFFEKSMWTVVAMLGVLKTGGACASIDSSYPLARIKQMVQDLESRFMLTSSSKESLVKDVTPNLTVLSRDTLTEFPDQLDFEPVSDSKNAAFIIFTSGSTGKPKGIILEHGNITTSIRDHSPGLRMSPRCRVLQFASYAFDASMYEIFTTLTNGACLCIASENDRLNNIVAFIRERTVNIAIFTPSTLSALRPEDVPSLEVIGLGGEAVSQEIVDIWSSRVHLVNGYGPAECTICSWYTISGNDWKLGTIGYIIGGIGWITQPSGPEKLASIGSVGELLIEGPVVARGYMNQPEKTREVFIEAPAWLKDIRNSSTGRLYRTGDLVQYNPDGTLRFIGRKDTQVKIRGQRVELSEVEHHVQSEFHDSKNVIAEVIQQNSTGRSQILVAFVNLQSCVHSTCKDDTGSAESPFELPGEVFQEEASRVRSELAKSCPRYMVPSAFIALNHIPLTNTGKADRKSLRTFVSELGKEEWEEYTGLATDKRATGSDEEIALQKLFSEILGVDTGAIWANQNFIDLGGDSILAIKLVSLARKFKFSFSVMDVVSRLSLAELAVIKNQEETFGENASIRPIGFELLNITDSGSFVDNIVAPMISFPGSDVFDVLPTTQFQQMVLFPCNYFVYELKGPVDIDRLKSACQALLDEHAILRSTFIKHDEKLLQVVLRPRPVAIKLHENVDALYPQAEEICKESEDAGVSLGTGFVAFHILKLSEIHWGLLVRISHAQFDGLSMQTFCGSLEAAYNGHQSPASASFSSYIHWVGNQQKTAGYTFWKDLLKGSSMTYIPRTLPSPTSSKQYEACFGSTEEIDLIQPPTSITMATLVKSAWSLLLAHMCGKSDLVFGQLVSGRGAGVTGMETVVGPCINIIPVRVTHHNLRTPLDLYRNIQQQFVRSIPYDNFGLHDIGRNCTDWKRDEIFGTVVQHQNIDESPGINLENIDCEMGWIPTPDVMHSLWVKTTAVGDKLRIAVITSPHIADSEQAHIIARDMGKVMERLAEDPKMSLAKIEDIW